MTCGYAKHYFFISLRSPSRMSLCPICLARHPAYLDFCPTERAYEFKSKVSLPKKDFFGQSPSLFVGRFGYPQVRIGLLANESVSPVSESPRTWAQQNTPIQDVAEMRSSLVNSYSSLHIKSFSSRFTETVQEVAQAKSPTDVEVGLTKVPSFSFSFSPDTLPHGPSIGIKKAATTSSRSK